MELVSAKKSKKSIEEVRGIFDHINSLVLIEHKVVGKLNEDHGATVSPGENPTSESGGNVFKMTVSNL